MNRKRITVLSLLLLAAACVLLVLAGCSKQSYTVTYEASGGTVAAPSKEVVYGEEFILDIPTRSDATFLGWFQSADENSKQITDEFGKSLEKYTLTTDSTVYAKWEYWDTPGLVYELTEDGTGYIAFAPEVFSGSLVKIPESHRGLPVVRVGTHGFSDLPSLTLAVIPASVESVGAFAFENCTELATIEGAQGVERVEERAFYGCESLLTYRFAENVSYIGEEAFSGCSMLRAADLSAATGAVTMEEGAFSGCAALSSVTFASQMQQIPASAFSGCAALQTAEIGGSIRQISDGAFSGCTNLRSVHFGSQAAMLGDGVFTGCTYLREITVDAANAAFSAENNILFDKSGTVLYRYAPYQEGTDYRVPDTVTAIRAGAFADAEYITDLYIGTGVRQIDSGALTSMQNIESLTIPFVGGSSYSNTWFSYVFGGEYSSMSANVPYTLKNVTVLSGDLLSERAFQFCNSLVSVTLPQSLTAVGAYAFYGCSSLTSLVFPAGLQTVGDYALMACTRLQSVSFDGENDHYTAENGLLYNKDKSVLLLYPAGKTESEFVVPDTVKEIAPNAFYYASRLESVTLPEGLQKIGSGAFLNCRRLESIVLPSALETLGSQAFADCTGLAEVTLPAGGNLTEIGRQAFYGCTGLQTVFVMAENPPAVTGDSVFLDTNDTFAIVFSSDEQRSAYAADSAWAEYGAHFAVRGEE